MDVKLNPSRTSSGVKPVRASKISLVFGYIQALKQELAKVSWTTKQELQFSTRMVIGATFLFGLGIYVVDLIIRKGLDLVGLVVHFIFG